MFQHKSVSDLFTRRKSIEYRPDLLSGGVDHGRLISCPRGMDAAESGDHGYQQESNATKSAWNARAHFVTSACEVLDQNSVAERLPREYTRSSPSLPNTMKELPAAGMPAKVVHSATPAKIGRAHV